jgi:hypothetical protein
VDRGEIAARVGWFGLAFPLAALQPTSLLDSVRGVRMRGSVARKNEMGGCQSGLLALDLGLVEKLVA